MFACSDPHNVDIFQAFLRLSVSTAIVVENRKFHLMITIVHRRLERENIIQKATLFKLYISALCSVRAKWFWQGCAPSISVYPFSSQRNRKRTIELWGRI